MNQAATAVTSIPMRAEYVRDEDRVSEGDRAERMRAPDSAASSPSTWCPSAGPPKRAGMTRA
jgi:hypothetical protein